MRPTSPLLPGASMRPAGPAHGVPSRPGPLPPGASMRPGGPLPGASMRPGPPLPGASMRPGSPLPGASMRPGAPLPGASMRPGAPRPGASMCPGAPLPGASMRPGGLFPGTAGNVPGSLARGTPTPSNGLPGSSPPAGSAIGRKPSGAMGSLPQTPLGGNSGLGGHVAESPTIADTDHPGGPTRPQPGSGPGESGKAPTSSILKSQSPTTSMKPPQSPGEARRPGPSAPGASIRPPLPGASMRPSAPSGPMIRPGPPLGPGASMRPGGPAPGASMRPGGPAPGASMRPGGPAPGASMRPGGPAPGASMRPARPAPGASMRPGGPTPGPSVRPGLPGSGATVRPGPSGPGASMRPGPPGPGASMRPGPPGPGASMRPGPPGPGASMRPGPPGPGASMRPGMPTGMPIRPGTSRPPGAAVRPPLPGASLQRAPSGIPSQMSPKAPLPSASLRAAGPFGKGYGPLPQGSSLHPSGPGAPYLGSPFESPRRSGDPYSGGMVRPVSPGVSMHRASQRPLGAPPSGFGQFPGQTAAVGAQLGSPTSTRHQSTSSGPFGFGSGTLAPRPGQSAVYRGDAGGVYGSPDVGRGPPPPGAVPRPPYPSSAVHQPTSLTASGYGYPASTQPYVPEELPKKIPPEQGAYFPERIQRQPSRTSPREVPGQAYADAGSLDIDKKLFPRPAEEGLREKPCTAGPGSTEATPRPVTSRRATRSASVEKRSPQKPSTDTSVTRGSRTGHARSRKALLSEDVKTHLPRSDSERLMVAFTDAYREKTTDERKKADIRVAPSALELLDVDQSFRDSEVSHTSRGVQTPLFRNTLAVAEKIIASAQDELPTDIPHVDDLYYRRSYPSLCIPNPRLTHPVCFSGHPHYLSSKLPINSGPFALQTVSSRNPYGIGRARSGMLPISDSTRMYGTTVAPRAAPGALLGWTSRTPSSLALSPNDRLLYGSPRDYWTDGYM